MCWWTGTRCISSSGIGTAALRPQLGRPRRLRFSDVITTRVPPVSSSGVQRELERGSPGRHTIYRS